MAADYHRSYLLIRSQAQSLRKKIRSETDIEKKNALYSQLKKIEDIQYELHWIEKYLRNYYKNKYVYTKHDDYWKITDCWRPGDSKQSLDIPAVDKLITFKYSESNMINAIR